MSKLDEIVLREVHRQFHADGLWPKEVYATSPIVPTATNGVFLPKDAAARMRRMAAALTRAADAVEQEPTE